MVASACLRRGLSLLRGGRRLLRFAREPYKGGRAREAIHRLNERRGRRFLRVVARAVFANPDSPYLALFRHLGCTYEDLRVLVRSRGLEGALQRLAGDGLYVTLDEMKGREPARRGAALFQFQPKQFDNPCQWPGFPHVSSGSTGAPTRVAVGPSHYREQCHHARRSLEINGLVGAEFALYLPPTEWALSRLLRLVRVGAVPRRWFCQVPVSPTGPARGAMARAWGLVLLARGGGLALPRPEFASPLRPSRPAAWLARVAGRGPGALMVTYPSTAARLATWAVRQGLDLDGCVLLVAGEPITEAKRRTIEAAGGACLPLFGATEMGEAAEACLAPRGSDDMHVYEHRFAVISHSRAVGTEKFVRPLLFTALSPASPKIMINAETGDAGVVERRRCECPWDRMGFHTHLRGLWSFARLTTEGLTLSGRDAARVLEEVLPRSFGGDVGDYQLVLSETEPGITVCRLLVHPRLGPLDEEAVRTVFLRAVRHGAGPVTSEFMRQSRQFQVHRREPAVLHTGKSPSVVFLREQPADNGH